MNIHKSQLFWCEQKGDRVLTHPQVYTNSTSNNQDGRIPDSVGQLEPKDFAPNESKNSWGRNCHDNLLIDHPKNGRLWFKQQSLNT